MSTILFQVAGAAAGFFIGGPEGARLGWMAGGLIGGAMQGPNELPPVFGPRLGDLKVQTSTYGVAIPRVYGTARIAGNIIWSTDIIETPTTVTVESGGKGGGSASEQTQTTYSYSQSFAVGLCEGPITGVRRVWANGKLIWTAADDADASSITASAGISLTVYLGTEDQLPSALQESYEGVGDVPGYRGLAYVEFTNLQLAQFGNRTPNMEFEVVVCADESVVHTLTAAHQITGPSEYYGFNSGGFGSITPTTTDVGGSPSAFINSVYTELNSSVTVVILNGSLPQDYFTSVEIGGTVLYTADATYPGPFYAFGLTSWSWSEEDITSAGTYEVIFE